jgi:hypothetical protein
VRPHRAVRHARRLARSPADYLPPAKKGEERQADLDAHLSLQHRRHLVRRRIALVVGGDPLARYDLESLLELPRGFVVAAL